MMSMIEPILAHPWIGILLGIAGLILCWKFIKAYLKVVFWIAAICLMIAGGVYYFHY